jgi:hypothetical protein
VRGTVAERTNSIFEATAVDSIAPRQGDAMNRGADAILLMLALVLAGCGSAAPPAPRTSIPATAAAATPLLPSAPPAWCRYAASFDALVPHTSGVSALEGAESGDFAAWRAAGPDVARRGRLVRDALADLERDPAVGALAREERLLEIVWITAIERSIAPGARPVDATAVFDTWDPWQNSAGSLRDLARKTYAQTCA